MVQLQASLEEISATNTQVAAISYDSVEVLAKFAADKSITFPLLSDEGSATINAVGLHHENGYPHPSTMIVDKNGKVLEKIYYDGHKKRHTPEELIKALKALP